MTYDEQRALIERALEGVRVVVCPKCGGRGDLPKGLYVTCPKCEGAGQIVQRVFHAPNGYNASP